MVLPGFHDAHVHLMQSGAESHECDLSDAETPAQTLDVVRAYAAAHPDHTWIRGTGWHLPAFPAANPHKKLLDAVVRDRPVYLLSDDGHSAWVNSRALALGGVTAKTPDPPKGRIEREARGRAPSGTLREAARDLVASKIPERSVEEYRSGLVAALEKANRLGITSALEADVTEPMLEAYRVAEARGELTARLRGALHLEPSQGKAQIPHLVELANRYRTPNGRFRPTAVKIFEDGVFEAKTAALIEPYVSQPKAGGGGKGTLTLQPASLEEVVVALDHERVQVHVHAVGDRAVRVTLDAFERARAANGPRDARHEIAHLQIVHPADRARFKDLGVVANFEPFWAFADENIEKLTLPFLGEARSQWLYPIASVLHAGAHLSCGSDWSVSSMDPLEGIQVGVTRKDPHDGKLAPLVPAEAMTLADMLACYTLGGAYAAFREAELGSIEVGKIADLVVLERNLMTLDASEIKGANVQLTLLEGRAVYADPKDSELAKVPR
jgi:predicted amidohydrolase YtcJ